MTVQEGKKAYERWLSGYVKKRDSLVSGKERDIAGIIGSARDDTVSYLRSLEEKDWTVANIPKITDRIEGTLTAEGSDLTRVTRNSVGDVYDFTTDNTDKGMAILGATIPLGRLTKDVLQGENLLVDVLIKDFSTQQMRKLSAMINMGIQGGESIAATATKIKAEFGERFYNRALKRWQYKKAMDHAVRIARTEMLRTDSIVDFQRTQQVEALNPTLRKYWMWSHKPDGRSGHRDAELRYKTHPIRMNEPFEVAPQAGGVREKMMYPRDPAGSAANVIHCACAMGKVFI